MTNSCLGGCLSVPDDYPLVLGCDEHVSSSCLRSLVVRALELHVFHISSIFSSIAVSSIAYPINYLLKYVSKNLDINHCDRSDHNTL